MPQSIFESISKNDNQQKKLVESESNRILNKMEKVKLGSKLQERLIEIIKSLNETDRRILNLFYYEELPVDKIAAKLGLKVMEVVNAKARILRMLEREIDNG